MEKRNDEKEDIEELDEDMEDINMKLIKKALITENEKAWNQGDLRKRITN